MTGKAKATKKPIVSMRVTITKIPNTAAVHTGQYKVDADRITKYPGQKLGMHDMPDEQYLGCRYFGSKPEAEAYKKKVIAAKKLV